jgi:hypothetical protein
MENLQKNNQTEILKKHSLYQTKKYTWKPLQWTSNKWKTKFQGLKTE